MVSCVVMSCVMIAADFTLPYSYNHTKCRAKFDYSLPLAAQQIIIMLEALQLISYVSAQLHSCLDRILISSRLFGLQNC